MVNLDMLANSAANELFEFQGKTVNEQHCWPFPTKDNPLKAWTPKEIKSYAKLQRENAQESPL